MIMAEPSASEPAILVEREPNNRSANKQPAQLASSIKMALGPKKNIDAAITGTRLIATDHMIWVVDSAERTCGEAVILTLLSVMILRAFSVDFLTC